MLKLALSAAVAGSFGAVLAMTPSTAAAQSTLGEIVVYGSDPCPRATDDEVVICKRLPDSERYRIPENMRSSGTPQERQAWVQRARPILNAGDTGINSCSAVGPGGHTGCLLEEIQQAKAAARQAEEEATAPED